MKACRIRLKEIIFVGEDNVAIPPGEYDGYIDGPGAGWPVIIYEDKEYDFVDENINVEFI